jgi:hypothetical protein
VLILWETPACHIEEEVIGFEIVDFAHKESARMQVRDANHVTHAQLDVAFVQRLVVFERKRHKRWVRHRRFS